MSENISYFFFCQVIFRFLLFSGSGSQSQVAAKAKAATPSSSSGDSIRKYFAVTGDLPLPESTDAIGGEDEGLEDPETVEDTMQS